MVKNARPIGILGGTFDPIHFGHLRLAFNLLQEIPLKEVRFMPCNQPLLKQAASATASQRAEMIHIAMHEQAGFILDKRELYRSTPSYMVDSLLSLREEYTDIPLCLIIGSDILSQ